MEGRRLATCLMLVALCLFHQAPTTVAHPCAECMDVYNFLQLARDEDDATGIDPCLQIADRLREQCRSMQEQLALNNPGSTHACREKGYCKEEDNQIMDSRMQELVSTTSPLHTALSMLQSSLQLQTQANFPPKAKFALRMFFFSIKMLIPCFWMLRYERGITKAQRPQKPPSLLQLEVVTSEKPLAHKPSLDPADISVPQSLEDAVSLLETALSTQSSTQFFWFFMLIGHWLLRYVHWFSWIVKYRLLRVRYWMSNKHDDPSFLYRPHIYGWGWEAHYRYWHGGAGSGGGAGGAGSEVDEDFAATDDKSIIIPPPMDEDGSGDGSGSGGNTQPYDLHNTQNERYYPDEINNDAVVVAKPYNYYNVSDERYYPDKQDEQFFTAPVFGQPVRNITIDFGNKPESLVQVESGKPVSAHKAHPHASVNAEKFVYHGKGEPKYSEVEEKAKQALLQLTHQDAQPLPTADHHAILGNGVSLTRKITETGGNPTSKSDNNAKAQLPDGRMAAPPSMYERLKQFKFADKGDEFPSLPEDEVEVKQGLTEFRKEDTALKGFVSPKQPVNDVTDDYVADADAVESDMVGALDNEFKSIESNRPMQLDNGAKWDGFDDIGLVQLVKQATMMLNNATLHSNSTANAVDQVDLEMEDDPLFHSGGGGFDLEDAKAE